MHLEVYCQSVSGVGRNRGGREVRGSAPGCGEGECATPSLAAGVEQGKQGRGSAEHTEALRSNWSQSITSPIT